MSQFEPQAYSRLARGIRYFGRALKRTPMLNESVLALVFGASTSVILLAVGAMAALRQSR